MLACGTGIAPMLQVARATVENEDEDTFVRCFFACRTQHDILLKEELDHLRGFWNFTITYVLSNSSQESLSSDPGKTSYGDTVHFGRMDFEFVQKEMSSFILDTARKRSMVLICGTKSFDKDMINYLTRTGCAQYAYFKF